MDALIWNSAFLTGLPTVDQQHERLVHLANEFGNRIARSAEVPRAELEAVVEELARYAVTHFVDEELLMRASAVDHRFVSMHEGQHARFLRDVAHMRASGFLDAPETTRALLRFLLHWLAFHILGDDMQLARQLERIARGESPEAAFTAEARGAEGPAQLLLGALEDLLRVISQRNAELLEANRTLEARVAERTKELEASVATLRATQVQLVETEKLASVGQLASGLAHEINNPLGFISSNLMALEEHSGALLQVIDAGQAVEAQLPHEARQQLAAARERADLAFVREDLGQLLSQTRDGVRRVQAIVRDLKDFTHVDDGGLIDLDLKSAVEATLKVLPSPRRQGVTWVTAFSELPRVRCQAAQVNHALLNLIENATQAVHDTPEHSGTVALRTGIEGDFAFIEVADTGVGMSPEVLAHAVEPFYTTRPPGQGTGLGLTTAYNCAQAHGGRLEAQSVAGEGSTFRLLLPLEGPSAVGTAANTLTDSINTRRSAAPAK